MAQTTQKVEIVNEHREALALALYEYWLAGNPGPLAPTRDLEYFRTYCNKIENRNLAMETPGVHQRYVQIRGFDPREVQVAPKVRWL